MTSAKTTFGFRPARIRGSGPNAQALGEYRIANGLATNIFNGDPVKQIADGTIVVASVTTDYAIGVFQGCFYVDANTKQPTFSRFFPTGTSSADSVIKALVADNAAQTFVIGADASVSLGDLGLNFDVSNGGGNTLSGASAFVLKASTRKNASGLVRVTGLYDTPDNAWGDAFTQVEVRFVQHVDTRVSAASA
jgi:hypothetical protein